MVVPAAASARRADNVAWAWQFLVAEWHPAAVDPVQDLAVLLAHIYAVLVVHRDWLQYCAADGQTQA